MSNSGLMCSEVARKFALEQLWAEFEAGAIGWTLVRRYHHCSARKSDNCKLWFDYTGMRWYNSAFGYLRICDVSIPLKRKFIMKFLYLWLERTEIDEKIYAEFNHSMVIARPPGIPIPSGTFERPVSGIAGGIVSVPSVVAVADNPGSAWDQR